MRRQISILARVLPTVAALGLLSTPALAQSTPQPSMPATTPPAFDAPMVLPGVTNPVMPGQRTTLKPGQNPRAQQGVATTPPASAPRPEPPRAPYLSGPNMQGVPAGTNIRLDLAITDTFTGSPVKKNVSLIVLQNNGGMIRTTSIDGWSNLNVDAIAAAYNNGQVSVRLTFEYTPPLGKDATSSNRPPRLNESITVVLQDGKPLVVSQSADPANDRKVTAELTATILK
jgi:hypothetical protein